MSSQEASTISPIKGILEFIERDNETGEIIDQSPGFNLVVNLGMETIIRSFTVTPVVGSLNNKIIQTFRIGNDVGTGNLLTPQAAQKTDTVANQSVVHTVNAEDLTVLYPNYYTVRYTTLLDGDIILGGSPDVDLRYSSASLVTGDNSMIAFRRFSTRTITRGVTVEVRWTLFFAGQE